MAKNKLILIAIAFLVIPVFAIAAESSATVKKTSAKTPVVNWYNSYETAVKIAKLEKKPLFIDFTAKWCTWCGKMDKEVLSHKDISAKLQKFVCVRIDVDKDRTTAYGYGVTSLPRVIVVNTHSEIVGDWLGYRERADFSKLLDDVVEYLRKKTGAIEAPKVTAKGGNNASPSVKTVSVDLSNREVVIEQLASKDPAVRIAVIAHLATMPKEAASIAAAGLSSKYLGIRIASWELMKKITKPPIEFDPWASTVKRNELLKLLITPGKPKDTPAEKPPEKAVKK